MDKINKNKVLVSSIFLKLAMLIILERIWMIDIEASLDTEKNNDICILTFSEPEWKLDELSDDIFRSEIEDKARVK